MLILQRNKNEGVVIRLADGTYLGRVILAEKGHHGARIGFDFLDGIIVNRDEVDARIQAQRTDGGNHASAS